MKQPEGFTLKGKKEPLCKLKKSLNGLKQSSRMWYQKFNTHILELGFVRSNVDDYVYSQHVGDHLINIVLFVDDMFLISLQQTCYKGGENIKFPPNLT